MSKYWERETSWDCRRWSFGISMLFGFKAYEHRAARYWKFTVGLGPLLVIWTFAPGKDEI